MQASRTSSSLRALAASALVCALGSACPVAVAPLGDQAFFCRNSDECARGFACVDGTCQREGTAPNTDAGSNDVAATDAATSDAAAADTTAGDAVRDDAADATPDASASDAAADDAAADDAATDDAATADAGPTCPPDWWDCDWSARVKLTFDNSQQDEDLLDFPVLVELTRARADLERTAPGGADLRFVDPDGDVVLAHEVERWRDTLSGWAWVKVPRINAQSTSDHIWMYYDNPTAADAQDTAAVWTEGYRAVLHLDANADSSIPLPGSDRGDSMIRSSQEGFIARGLGLNGAGDRVLLSASDAVLGTLDDMTISAWVRRDELDNGWRGIVSARHLDENDYSSGNFAFHCNGDGFGLENNAPFNSSWMAEVATPRQWHLLSMVVDTAADVGLLYLDGREVERWEDAANTPTWSDQDEVRIGARWFHGNETAYLEGAMDEVRVAHVARSPAWLRAQYLAQSDAFLRYGEEEWLRPAFSHRVKLSFVSDTQQENLVDFPVLVTLDSGLVDYGLIQADGDDLRFLDADGSLLAHEIDDWDHGGTSQIWVRVPQVNAYNITDHIWLYYGNPVVTSAEDATGTWSDAYVAVWHLSDLDDSTANANHGVNHGTASAAGLVSGARDVDDDGDQERVEVADHPSLDQVSDALTTSLWINRQQDQTDWACGMAREMDTGGLNIFWLGYTGNQYMFITSRAGAEQRLSTSSEVLPVDQWFFLAGTYNTRKMRLFADGVEVAEIERTGSLPEDDNPVSIGGDTNDHGGWWDEQPEALLDEARLQRVARGHAWMLAERWSMSDALVLYGAPQQR